MEKTVRSRFAAITLSKSSRRFRTGLASPVENQACGIAKHPRLRVHRHEARLTPAQRCCVYRSVRPFGRHLGLLVHGPAPPRPVLRRARCAPPCEVVLGGETSGQATHARPPRGPPTGSREPRAPHGAKPACGQRRGTGAEGSCLSAEVSRLFCDGANGGTNIFAIFRRSG
jgi:hypothetical protein